MQIGDTVAANLERILVTRPSRISLLVDMVPTYGHDVRKNGRIKGF